MKKLMSFILAGVLLFSLSSRNVVYVSDSRDQDEYT